MARRATILLLAYWWNNCVPIVSQAMGPSKGTPFDEVLKAEVRRELADVMALRGCDLEMEAILEKWG